MPTRHHAGSSGMRSQGTENAPLAARQSRGAEQWAPDDPWVSYPVVYPRRWRTGSHEAFESYTGYLDTSTANATSTREEITPVQDRVVRLPAQQRERDRFLVLQKWEGTVRTATRTEFIATLHDLSDPSRPDEEVVLLKDEISDSDLPLLESGAVFYWSIGYRVDEWGSRERVSALRFRRLPVWTRRDLDDIARKVNELKRAFGESH